MKKNELNVRQIIAQAWLGMALLIMMMQITDILEACLNSNFSFAEHLKMAGIWNISIMLCINIVVQVSVQTFNGPVARKAILVMSVLYTAYMILHQVTHLIGGDRFDIHFVFDSLHHILGIWAIIYSVKWIKIGKEV